MKRFFSAILALVMLFQLSGCSAYADKTVLHPLNTEKRLSDDVKESVTGNDEWSPVRFSDMKYREMNISELEGILDEARKAMKRLNKDDTVNKINECIEWMDEYYTMYALADIHSSADVTDKYFADEYYRLSALEGSARKLSNEFAETVDSSVMSLAIKDSPEWEYFYAMYVSDEELSPKIVELMERESALTADYRALMASPTINYKGEERDYYEYLSGCSYLNYYKVLMTYYEKYTPEVADIYIELVRVREELANELGYDSYEQMAYDNYGRDYSPEDVEQYFEDIKTYMVPVFKEYNSYSTEIMDAEVDRELLMDCLTETAGNMSDNLAEAVWFMNEYELCNTDVSSVKAPGAYTIFIHGFCEPYIHMGATGYTDDVLTLIHEFGHFADYYFCPAWDETLDVAECYSLGLELLLSDRLDLVLMDEDAREIMFYELLDTLVTYVQQASFAEFEHRVYELGADRLNVEVLNEISRQVAEEYGYIESGAEDYYAMSWIDIEHFFEFPFYVLSYTVSNGVALQIYEAEREEHGAGAEIYERMLTRESAGFMDFIDEVGFDNPFEAGQVKRTADFLMSLIA